MAKQKDLNEKIVRGREIMTRVKKDDEDDFTSNGKFDGLIEKIYVPTREEIDQESDEMFDELLEQNLDDFARKEGIVFKEEPLQHKQEIRYKNPLDNLINKIVKTAMSQGLLERGWQKDEDYLEAVVELVQKNGDYTVQNIRQSIKKLYG